MVCGIKRGEEFEGDNGKRGIVKLQGIFFLFLVHGVVESNGMNVIESLVIAGDKLVVQDWSWSCLHGMT